MMKMPNFFTQDESGMPSLDLPLLPLRDVVVFPCSVVPLFVGRPKSINALTHAMNNEKQIFVTTQHDLEVDDPGEGEVHKVGTICSILQLLRLPDGTVKVLVEGKVRARIKQFKEKDEAFEVSLEPVPEISLSAVESKALSREIINTLKEYARSDKNIAKEFVQNVIDITDPSKLCDTVAANFSLQIKDKQQLLEMEDIHERLVLLLNLMHNELEIFTVTQKIKSRVKKQMEKTQRNYYLNEQIRAIKKEMGATEEGGDDLEDLENRINEKQMSREAKDKALQEFKRLTLMPPMSSEATVVRNYIDWLLSLPWYQQSEVNHDLNHAEEILNEDHYGLEKPKERILEYLAVQTLVDKLRGPILCLVGPPGVGKTSLAKSVARATGRKFARLSLGGVRDEAEIRGHRRTYIGAMPGKIIHSLKKTGKNNPVFCLDEIDKMSMDFRGDPSSALLEVLDPEQNATFNDHYLDVDYDLSDIFFITTANTLPDIPMPLQDRMEIIRIPGYTEYEKYHIAKDFLLPKQLKLNGLEDRDIRFSKNAFFTIIQKYTREAGVRNLEREISTICRKIALDLVKNKPSSKRTVKVNGTTLNKYLGESRYRFGQIELKDRIGLVTGLAWTQAGGELLSVETVIMPGKGKLIVTGKLGDVMKESAQAAVSYVRSRSKYLQIDDKFYTDYDIHIHVPEGAIPKDGPSAGIVMCTSIVSALTNRPVSRDIAMTGEITLRGRILPIGGLKEKILAAHRGGITKVLIPEENKKDIKEIPSSVLKQVKILTVQNMDEVLSQALIVKAGDVLFHEELKGLQSHAAS
jgi:ATP-dependent Lon protease